MIFSRMALSKKRIKNKTLQIDITQNDAQQNDITQKDAQQNDT